MYLSAALLPTIKIQRKSQAICKYAAFYCNVNFVTLQLVYLAFIFIAQTGLQSASDTEQAHKKRMQLSVYGGQEHSFGLEGLYYFFLIFCLRFLCNIYYRYSVFLKLRKILIQQQRSNNIVILEAKHAKFRNKLCHYKRRLCHTQNNN